jgi:hypothetical protein
LHASHAYARISIRFLRRRRRGYALRALTCRVLQVFLPRYHSRTPRAPAAIQPALLPAQISTSTSLIFVVLDRLPDVHFLCHFRLELSTYSHDLLRHVAAPAVLVVWRLEAFSYQFVGAALVLAVHILRCEARVTPAAFYSFVSFAQARTNAAAS